MDNAVSHTTTTVMSCDVRKTTVALVSGFLPLSGDYATFLVFTRKSISCFMDMYMIHALVYTI